MAKVRVSTTVDAALLDRAREVHGTGTDASLLEAALTALVDARRRAEVDAAYERGYSRELPAPPTRGETSRRGARRPADGLSVCPCAAR